MLQWDSSTSFCAQRHQQVRVVVPFDQLQIWRWNEWFLLELRWFLLCKHNGGVQFQTFYCCHLFFIVVKAFNVPWWKCFKHLHASTYLVLSYLPWGLIDSKIGYKGETQLQLGIILGFQGMIYFSHWNFVFHFFSMFNLPCDKPNVKNMSLII